MENVNANKQKQWKNYKKKTNTLTVNCKTISFLIRTIYDLKLNDFLNKT